MYKNIKVEAEHNELILENSHGDKVIIPANKRNWVKQKLSEGCHDCIDSLVETLPIASQYAQDGSVYPPNKKVKVNQDNQIKEYDISSPEYRDLYNSGKLMSYDKNTDTYIATPLKEATITAEAPQWLKYKREYEKNNPKSDYINQYLNPFARSLGNTETNYPKRLDNEYEEKSLDYVSEQLVKNKPQGKLSRAEWLNQMSDKEEEIIKRNPKYQSSLWADTKRGLTSLVEQNPLQTFKNILNSSDYTNREKQEMLKDYADHPVMSKLGDATKILNPLTVPSKMVQSAYKDDYSFTDALKGKKNNAGIVEDIVTDPLNLVGLGIWSKLKNANKFKNLDEVYQTVKGLNKEEQLSKINNIVQDAKKIEYNPSNNLIIKSIDNGSPLEKSLSKNGEININTLQAHINNNATSKADKYILNKVIDAHFPNKTSINYNELKNKISDELVELNKTDLPMGNKENYGLDRIGFPNNSSASFTGKVPIHYQEIFNNRNNPNTFYKGHDNKYWFEALSMDKGFDTKEDGIKWLESQINHNKQMNKTITFSNEEKFGRGSSDHFDENTLGHSRVFVSPDEPDVFHVLESQSDFYQKNKLKDIDIEKHQKSLNRMEELQNKNKEVLKNMKEKGVDEAGLPVQQYQIKQFEDLVKSQESANNMKRGDIANFEQKRLLGNNHLERLFQENMDYAAKNGQNKLRYPTSETAAKIQGYKKLQREVPQVEGNQLASPPEVIDLNTNTNYYQGVDFLPEHKTILKKYEEFPKMSKKIFNQEPKIVTDVKGNTWYELEIPKAFKERKGKIKALSTLPLGIGLQQYHQSQNQNKSEQ